MCLLNIPVTASEASPFGEDQLQFGCGSSRYQRPNERQSVLIKICLEIKMKINKKCSCDFEKRIKTDRRHERVEDADGERGTAGKGLSEVELRVRIVVIVLVQKLHVAIVHQFWDNIETI